MIKLENIHRAMNDKTVQDIAQIAFDTWIEDGCYDTTAEEISRLIKGALAITKVKSTAYRKFALEALLMMKIDGYKKEVTCLGDLELDQCAICSKYYRKNVLDKCSACREWICEKCSTYDDEYDWTECQDCVSNLR